MPTIAKLAERFTETDIDGEIVLMRLDNGEFFALSGTAAATWRLIDGRRDRAALVEQLAAEFDAAAEHIAPDVDEFVARLKDRGLLAER